MKQYKVILELNDDENKDDSLDEIGYLIEQIREMCFNSDFVRFVEYGRDD